MVLVLVCHRLPPCDVSRRRLLRWRAIAVAVHPSSCRVRIRNSTSSEIVERRPSCTPRCRAAASASLVRTEIIWRSNWAKLLMTLATNSPFGVVVSTPRSSATNRHVLHAFHKGCELQDGPRQAVKLGDNQQGRASAWWRQACSALSSPGRWAAVELMPASS